MSPEQIWLSWGHCLNLSFKPNQKMVNKKNIINIINNIINNNVINNIINNNDINHIINNNVINSIINNYQQ